MFGKQTNKLLEHKCTINIPKLIIRKIYKFHVNRQHLYFLIEKKSIAI